MYNLYIICCNNLFVTDTYTGITRDIELTIYFHKDDTTSYLYEFINSHGGWINWSFILDPKSYDTLEEAKNNKISGSLNIIYNTSSVATIYKIYSKDQSIHDQYIGQTINFENRKFSHFYTTCWGQTKNKNKLYEFIRSHGGWTNWKMEIIKRYPYCLNKYELERLEWYWWKTLGGTLNSVNPGSNKNKYKNSDEEFEGCVSIGNSREKFSIKEISLDI